MDLTALRDHFQAATRPMPGPLGDDAIEWDYSRISRALGLVGRPSLEDLPDSGVAIIAQPPERWDETAASYRQWAADAGWGFVRVSARPTVVVPDPVVYGLAMHCSGPDSLILARASRARRPRLGRRARAAGSSIPLLPGERWLIAADRVRRRCCLEAAEHGLVIFVEESELLNASALNVLSYLIRAHRAWKGRMLSRDAKCYVAFAVDPRHEGSLEGWLRRFGVRGDLGGLRQEAAPNGRPPTIDVEEEHILAALRDAPMAFDRKDITALFGQTGRTLCDRLRERGLIQVREEAGRSCPMLKPSSWMILDEPEPRVRRAMFARYRQRARWGHEHVIAGAMLLALRMGNVPKARACLARLTPADAACIPLIHVQEIDEGFRNGERRLRCMELAALMALHVHVHDYGQARDLAMSIRDTPFETVGDLSRALRHLLSVGRTHLDEVLPDDFWVGLKARRLTASLLEVTCILAELFARMRLMRDEDVVARYNAACTLSEGVDRILSGERSRQLRKTLDVLKRRVEAWVRQGPEGRSRHLLEQDLRNDLVPAYVGATALFAEMQAVGDDDGPRYVHRCVCLDLCRATGNPTDLSIQYASLVQRGLARNLRLASGASGDELLLLSVSVRSGRLRRVIYSILLGLGGRTAYVLNAHPLLLGSGDRDSCENLAFDAASMAQILLRDGDYGGARDAAELGVAAAAATASSRAYSIHVFISTMRSSLAWEQLEVAERAITTHAASLPGYLTQHLTGYLRASTHLCNREFALAAREFRCAAEVLDVRPVGELVMMARNARCDAMVARGLSEWDRTTRTNHASEPLQFGPLSPFLAIVDSSSIQWVSLRSRIVQSLDVCVLLTERFYEASQVPATTTMRVAKLLWDTVDEELRAAGQELSETLSRYAPTFLAETIGAVAWYRSGTVIGPDGTGIRRALRAQDVTAGLDLARLDKRERALLDPLDVFQVRRRDCSVARFRRGLADTWPEDQALLDHALSCREPRRVRVYGFVRTGSSDISISECAIDPTSCANVRVTISRCLAPRHEPASAQLAPRAPIGRSARWVEVLELARVAARCNYPVLITGETGTGKEHLAHFIHTSSSRGGSEPLVIQCGSIVEALVESEIFGHEKGAFTGATNAHEGYLAQANGSTLVLDGPEAMSLRTQALLLRAVEHGEYRRVGAAVSQKSDFRLITLAQPALISVVERGEFREDLYYRLSALKLNIPPLREREGDAVLIARDATRRRGWALEVSAEEAILAAQWPGNVRQLLNCIEFAASTNENGRIRAADLLFAIGQTSGTCESRERHDAAEIAWRRANPILVTLGSFGARDFASAAEVSVRSAQRFLARLLRANRVARIGAGRATRYRVAP